MKIAQNIKKIRHVKGLNQSQFAMLFDLSRASVGAYEEKRAVPKMETLIQIANHFSISLDHLVQSHLTVNDIHKFSGIEQHLNQAPLHTEWVNALHFNSKNDFIENNSSLSFQIPQKASAGQKFYSFNEDRSDKNPSSKILIYKAQNVQKENSYKNVLIATHDGVYFPEKVVSNKHGTLEFEKHKIKQSEITTFAELTFSIEKHEETGTKTTNPLENRVKQLENKIQQVLSQHAKNS